MRLPHKNSVVLRPPNSLLALLILLLGTQYGLAQAPQIGRGPMPKMPLQIKSDPRVQQHKYRFAETNEDLAYVLYVSSRSNKG